MSLALAVALCLAQQGDPVLAGRVVDEHGKPVADAKVTLLARPIPRHLDPAHEHRVTATTDAHGAFRAPLHADDVYSVWAATASAATAIAEGESAPGFVELRLAPGTGPRTVPVAGLDAWSESATFRYRALVGGENLDFVPVVCRDGALAVPPMPLLGNPTIEVLGANDRVLCAMSGAVLELPAPATCTVRAVDDKGAPLAGVEVLTHLCNYWATESAGVVWGERFRDLWPSQGTTGADGTLTLRCLRDDDLWLLSRKEGFATSLDGITNGKWMRGGKLVPIDPQVPRGHFDVTLRPAPPVVLPLVTSSGAPAAVDTLFLTVRINAKGDDGGGFGQPFSFALPIVAGRASVSALPADTEFEVAATRLAPAAREQLREDFGFAPAALTFADAASLAKGAPFDAKQWHALAVITSDGRPAANTAVFLGTAASQGTMRRTDRRGRLLIEATKPVRASVYSHFGLGTALVDGDETKLELSGVRPTKGRVVDEDGKPVAGICVQLELRDASGGAPGEYQTLAWLLPHACSDADGHFEVLLPPFAAGIVLHAANSKRRPKLGLEWDPEKPADLVLTVPR